MDAYLEQLREVVVSHVPTLVIAILVLVAGWMAALFGSWLTRLVLKKTSVDNRIAKWVSSSEEEEGPEIEAIAARVVFWVLMIFVLVAFFSYLGLTAVATPLGSFLEEIFAFLPRLLSAAALLGIAWLLATGLRFAVTRVLAATTLDERFGAELSEGSVSPSKSLGDTVYWLVFLLFLPAVLDTLGLEGLMGPVNELLNEAMAFLPNLLGALLILGVGWLLARVIQRVVTSVLSAAGSDSLGDRIGLDRVLGDRKLSSLVGLVVYILVLVPVVIASLDALSIDAVTAPASEMLNQLLTAVPQIFGAIVIVTIAYLVGRLVAGLVTKLLSGIGFDRFLARIGFGPEPSAQSESGEQASRPSQWVGWVALVALMLFATIEALELLGFGALAAIVLQFTIFGGNVLLGVVILALGLYLARLATAAIESSGSPNATLLATWARWGIVVLAATMALRQAGVAEDIITLAFGLLLGAAAVAVAIAFGIGGRNLAARQLARWVGRSVEEDETAT